MIEDISWTSLDADAGLAGSYKLALKIGVATLAAKALASPAAHRTEFGAATGIEGLPPST
jgi:hypothetical protein